MLQSLVEKTWQLSDTMLTVARRPLFTTALVADKDKNVLAIKSGWAGGEPDEPSRGPYYGPAKAVELVETIGSTSDSVVITPVPEYPTGSGYMGGVRRLHDGVYLITTASAWSERCDALFALAMNHSMVFETRFHHIGFRHASERDMRLAVAQDEAWFGMQAVYLPAKDHERYYIRVNAPEAPNGVYWVEHQYFPQGPHSKGIHWDLATMGDLLGSLGKHLKIQPTTWEWEAGINDPFGLVGLNDRDGTHLAIMQRDRWTDVDTW